MMDPVIKYQGKKIMVTPDTAAELVFKGDAELVSGKLSEWPPVAAKHVPEHKQESEPEPKPKRAYRKKAK